MPVKLQSPEEIRQTLLEQAFCDIPSKVAKYELRPLSAGSFTLLGRIGNIMMVGRDNPGEAISKADTQAAMFEAAAEYIWVHSAPIEDVTAIETADQIPLAELKIIAFSIPLGAAFAFLNRYQECSLRLAAALAETEPEDDDGKPGKPLETLPVGSPASSTPAEPAETQQESVTSSGICPSSEPSPTSTLPMLPTEPAVDGPCLTCLPDLPATPEETPPSESSPP